jgi:hypothetical protein
MTSKELSPSSRFRNLWDVAATAEDTPLIAIVTEPYVQGSFRPEVRVIGALIGDELVSVRNVDVAGHGIDQAFMSSLAKLEDVV